MTDPVQPETKAILGHDVTRSAERKVVGQSAPTADALIANVDKTRANRAQALKDAADPPETA